MFYNIFHCGGWEHFIHILLYVHVCFIKVKHWLFQVFFSVVHIYLKQASYTHCISINEWINKVEQINTKPQQLLSSAPAHELFLYVKAHVFAVTNTEEEHVPPPPTCAVPEVSLPFKCWNSRSSFFLSSTCSKSCFCSSSENHTKNKMLEEKRCGPLQELPCRTLRYF